MDINLDNISTHTDGKAGFMVGLFEQMNLPAVFDKHLESQSGRPPEIPYGILAEMMLVNICDDHHPLSRLDEYYEYKDLEGIFHHPISLPQINDDRFGGFLDLMHEAGPRKIFAEIAANAFTRYGIRVKNINYDTTSKVMWGLYESDDEVEGIIKIDYGYSKQKREDKNQIKMALGAAEGIVVDAKVLSGNMDDKTYNNKNLDDVESLLNRMNIDKNTFYYIADSALFSEENLKKADARKINLITRVPDNTKAAKSYIIEAAPKLESLQRMEYPTSKGVSVYRIAEKTGEYKGIPLKYAVCYSESLREKKLKTLEKQASKELDALSKLIKSYKQRTFACLEDAEKEISQLQKKTLKKLKYHDVTLEILEHKKARRGRPPKDPTKAVVTSNYKLSFDVQFDEFEFEQRLRQSCTFVLCSNDLSISAEKLLREYKTQDSVEKKFQQLKSPQFVNSLYLESTKRVEAMAYLMIIAVMVLSVAEHVVRLGLKEDNDFIIGPGKIKMTKPTLMAIYQIFYTVQTMVIRTEASTHRRFTRLLRDNVKKVLKYLGIPEDTFISGCPSTGNL